jgi:hypothetical protein
MKPGDIVFCEDRRFGIHRFYKIVGCFHGAQGCESLIELKSLTEKPGVAYGQDMPETTFVPEPLLRAHTVYTPDISPGQRNVA